MSDNRLFELFTPPLAIALSTAAIIHALQTGAVDVGVSGGILLTLGLAHQTIIIREKYEVDT